MFALVSRDVTDKEILLKRYLIEKLFQQTIHLIAEST